MDDCVDGFASADFLKNIQSILPADTSISVCVDFTSNDFQRVVQKICAAWGYALTPGAFNGELYWENVPVESISFLSRIKRNIATLRNVFSKNCMVHLNARLRPIILEVVGELPH
jgi:hypothetical protein